MPIMIEHSKDEPGRMIIRSRYGLLARVLWVPVAVLILGIGLAVLFGYRPGGEEIEGLWLVIGIFLCLATGMATLLTLFRTSKVVVDLEAMQLVRTTRDWVSKSVEGMNLEGDCLIVVWRGDDGYVVSVKYWADDKGRMDELEVASTPWRGEAMKCAKAVAEALSLEVVEE